MSDSVEVPNEESSEIDTLDYWQSQLQLGFRMETHPIQLIINRCRLAERRLEELEEENQELKSSNALMRIGHDFEKPVKPEEE